MRTAIQILIFLAGLTLAAAPADQWILDNGQTQKQLQTTASGLSAQLQFPGEIRIYQTSDRRTFRPVRADFEAGELSTEILQKSGVPVQVRFFVKDKDGAWFAGPPQTLTPGKKQQLRIRLDRNGGRDWVPSGHSAPWSADVATHIFTTGLVFYSTETGTAEVVFSPVQKTGKRPVPPLMIKDWEMAASTGRYQQTESRFHLSRDYFNPFDPDEIQVDFEVCTPSGKTGIYPAFYAQDFIRTLQSNIREVAEAKGMPFWAFRFTPHEIGIHKIRLLIKDNTPGHEAKIVSPWKEIKVQPSANKGFIRVSRKNPAYFEYTNGEFFYPVGINIHTNIDLRSEYRFKFGHLPDRGTYDYEMYFEAFAKAGVNTAEVWMASWTYALEWSSASAGYYGLGRYNLNNAWRLDRLLDSAGKNNIHINLVWDNHGKTSVSSDQEWNDNPYNAHCYFAKSNAGFLQDAGNFFREKEVRKYNDRRNRYIAARWGADTRIFAMEQWSEVDLVNQGRETYADGTMQDFHRHAATHYTAMSQGPQLITTHVCSNWQRSLEFRQLFDLPEHTHWAGDAYRSERIHIADLLRAHGQFLRYVMKPVLATEFGGTSSSADYAKVTGDIHGGLWSSLFTHQAGTPFLWWHDYVFICNHFQHYSGFASFIKGLDLRTPALRTFPETEVLPFAPNAPEQLPDFARPAWPNRIVKSAVQSCPQSKDLALTAPWPLRRYHVAPHFPGNNDSFDAMTSGSPDMLLGWVFRREGIYEYPEYPEIYPPAHGLAIRLPEMLAPGRWQVDFYDTMTGEIVASGSFRRLNKTAQIMPLPPFLIDVAFKLYRLPGEKK